MRKGFTLAELLIALAILGVIATFTIPKVLQSQQDSKKKAILKEVISNLSEITYMGAVKGEITGPQVYNYFKSKLNHIKACPTNAATEGCWTHAADDSTQLDEPGFILHNGATVAGFDTSVGCYEHIAIDYDGPQGANTEGVDQVSVRIVFCTDPPYKIGSTIAHPTRPTSITFYEQIFQ